MHKKHFYLSFQIQIKSKYIELTSNKKIPKFDMKEKQNLNFPTFFALHVHHYLITIMMSGGEEGVLWLNPLMVEEFYYSVDITEETKYWKCVLEAIGTF